VEVWSDDPTALAIEQLGAQSEFENTLVRPKGPISGPPIPGVGYRRAWKQAKGFDQIGENVGLTHGQAHRHRHPNEHGRTIAFLARGPARRAGRTWASWARGRRNRERHLGRSASGPKARGECAVAKDTARRTAIDIGAGQGAERRVALLTGGVGRDTPRVLAIARGEHPRTSTTARRGPVGWRHGQQDASGE